MEEDSIFVLTCETGEYSDYRVDLLGAFDDKDKAIDAAIAAMGALPEYVRGDDVRVQVWSLPSNGFELGIVEFFAFPQDGEPSKRMVWSSDDQQG